MATPTPAPSSNTPQKHLVPFSSPAPRSVPHTGNTGMINYDSPAVLNMLHEGAIGMGISMSGMGMSQLGLSASAMGRADEEERRRRLQSIIDTLKERPGRVGEEGIVALCKKMGVDVEKMMDEEGLTLIIGNEAMCDIFIRNDEVENVKLQTALDDEKQRPDLQFGPAGSQILLKSLRPLPSQNKINVTLDRFSENLDKLLRLDKLGAPENGGVSCYHAIAGVYTSLKKLFEHEKKMALSLLDEKAPYVNHKAEREVLCKKSGRPRLNGGLCLGLSLEYWMDRRHMIRGSRLAQSASSKGKGKMLDPQPVDEYPEDTDLENNRIYSLTIECEASPSALFTPIRISNDWISSAIEKPADANDATQSIDNILLNTASIDWQDPKPTYLETSAPSGDPDSMNLDSTPGRLPNIRFIAKFNPPLVVPLTVYISLHQAVGIEPNAQEFRATTFTGLALRPEEPDPGMMGTVGEQTHEIRSSKTVLVVDAEGQEKEKRHDLSLYVPKMEYSKTLESLPFSHPRQLVEILPTLRQYAYTTSLVQHSFYEKERKSGQKNPTTLLSPSLTPKTPDNTESPLQLDLNLYYTPPAPRITFHVPHPSSNTSLKDPSASASDILASLLSTSNTPTILPIHVQVDIHPNAQLAISDQNILPPPRLPDAPKDVDVDMDKAQESEDKQKRLARALDVCGDLSVWGEWLRREVTKRGLGKMES